jgi:phospholipid/cholesterol/gamma-HCH transport system substrate-binding protein
MESEKRYFYEGLFIVVFVALMAAAFIWLAKTGHRDDVMYRIRFAESVAGLALGDPVKYQGVDVGHVKSMELDADDPSIVVVSAALGKDAPVKTDTRATLRMKGVTGTMYIELHGGSKDAAMLAEATQPGRTPEIASEKSTLNAALDALPRLLEGFGAIQQKTQRLLTDVGEVTKNAKIASKNVKETTEEVKEDPRLLIWKKKK